MTTSHLKKLFDTKLKRESVSKEEFNRIAFKYTQFQKSNKQYINMFDILYDYYDMRDFKGLCLKLHGMKEEDVQIIIQEFINDGLINPLSDMNIVPSLSTLGYIIYHSVKSIQKNTFSSEFINAYVDKNIVKLIFMNCPQTIAFFEKYPITTLIKALDLEPDEITLELKYSSNDEALDVFNKIKVRIESFFT